MSDDSPQLLFQTDPKLFMEIIFTNDDKSRFEAIEKYSFVDMMICEFLRYGIFNEEKMIPETAELYSRFMMQAPAEKRLEIYNHIRGFVENTTFVSANAFLPFVAKNSSKRIVATAVIDYSSSVPLTNDDPMTGPKDILQAFEGGALLNPGAAFGGLLSLGDERVCQLLTPHRDSLGSTAANEAVQCFTGLIYSATVDFYLDWLERIEGDVKDGELYGIVASGLVLLKRGSQDDVVFTGRRPFPTGSVTAEQWQAMRKPIPLSEYLTQVAPRFYELERSEPPPRLMPHVLTTWGLQPTTDPSEVSPLDGVSH